MRSSQARRQLVTVIISIQSISVIRGYSVNILLVQRKYLLPKEDITKAQVILFPNDSITFFTKQSQRLALAGFLPTILMIWSVYSEVITQCATCYSVWH